MSVPHSSSSALKQLPVQGLVERYVDLPSDPVAGVMRALTMMWDEGTRHTDISSIPTLMRTSLGSSPGEDRARCSIRDSTPPKLVAA